MSLYFPMNTIEILNLRAKFLGLRARIMKALSVSCPWMTHPRCAGVCLRIDMWKIGCCPCSLSSLSMSLINLKGQQGCCSLAPVPLQELPKSGCNKGSNFLFEFTPKNLFRGWYCWQGSGSLGSEFSFSKISCFLRLMSRICPKHCFFVQQTTGKGKSQLLE